MSPSQSRGSRSSGHAVFHISLLAACALMLGGCAYIPSAGPLKADVEGQYRPHSDSNPFELVDVTRHTIQVLSQRPDTSLAKTFGDDASAPELLVGPGDGLTVSIWEAGTQPLFAPATSGQQAQGAHGAVLPEQTVGSDGCISIPFAGRIPVAGHSLEQIQGQIEAALAGKAARPQVLVSRVRNVTDTVTVVGEVTGGGLVPLSPHGGRLLDVLAAAGGIRAPAYETWVSLTRAGLTLSVPLMQVLGNTGENVFLHPGDILSVTRQPETFTVFGATGRNAQIDFDAAHLNLIQAVAKAGGLQDQRADPRGVFLFRQEPAAIAEALANSSSATSGKPDGTATDATVPVVYRLDMTRINSYFLGGNFELRNGDVIYVANAPANDLQKFLQLLGLVTQPVVEGVVLHSAIK
ncbi:MAG: polysaccharide biosynthesis/export family protein [Stenotrophobium sp.]